MVKRQINLEESFGSALQAREIPILQREIEKLKQQLEQHQQLKAAGVNIDLLDESVGLSIMIMSEHFRDPKHAEEEMFWWCTADRRSRTEDGKEVLLAHAPDFLNWLWTTQAKNKYAGNPNTD